ncbi:radical SAM protein [Thiobacter aerophilum]|uniref:Radical SAM protein n=1 Tax=Thiobacter aerophilum TaxID=3121275 RepID=A0ABV0EI06_9BURK
MISEPDPSWGIEAFDAAPLDARLVGELLAQATPSPVRFHVPSFKAYRSSEIASCGMGRWPAVSITGPDCALACDHCKAKILAPMIPAPTPDALWRVVNEEIARGAHGMLLTGGSNRRNEVEYDPYLPVLRRIKDSFPRFGIALHTALTDETRARALAEAGIDVAMMDVIGAQDTLTQVYHLKRPVADFEASLAALVASGLRVVPHIVLGLHYGRLLGEWQALEMVARHRPHALVLVVAMPFYAPPTRPFATPNPEAVGRFFLDARRALPGLPILLGCARPPGRARLKIDAYAVLAGLNAVAHPAEGVVELAHRLGREVHVMPGCCALAGEVALGAEILGAAEAPPGRPPAFPVPVVTHG